MTIPSRLNEICKKCGAWEYCESPFMEGDGNNNPNILIIGEAPGSDEDDYGKPFVGASGKYLKQVLSEMGVDIKNSVRFTNIVRCRPVDNKISKKTINCCKKFVIDEINDHDPDQVWLLGNSPLNGILGESGITNWNGVIVDKERTYIPLFHPAYILRNNNNLTDWLNGMLDALEYDGSKRDKEYERIIPKTIKDIDDMYRNLKKHEYISYDTETSDLDAFSDHSLLLSVSFAGGDKSYSVVLEHPESWWNDDEFDYVIGVMCDIIEDHDGRLIGQNMKFDQMHTFAQLDIEYKAGGDTMLVSHLLDSRPGIHGLKRLAGVHLGMYEYEQELTDYVRLHSKANPSKGGSYAYIPVDILLPYGGMDAEATLSLHKLLYPKLSDKQKILYKELILPASDALGKMQINGIALDSYISKRYERVYTIRRDSVYEEILKDYRVKKLTRDRQRDIDEHIAGTKRMRKIFKFNPNSFMQLGALCYDYYGMPVLGRTETGKPTTKGAILKELEDDYPILKSVRYYKLLSKMLNTYLTPAAEKKWVSGDGRVRTNFNLHGTRTGRLSSSNPVNLQNIPTPEKEPGTLLETLPIKNIFTHSYVKHPNDCIISISNNGVGYNFTTMYNSGVIMSVDYSGAELRVFASLAKCEAMLEIHRSGRDFHTMIASMLTGTKYGKITKPVRYVYKWTNWTLFYGGDENTLYGLYKIPLDKGRAVIKDYFTMFPEVPDYQDECVEFAEVHGYIESPFGRREILPYINDSNYKKKSSASRSAINMPVQSATSDILLIALVIISDKLSKMHDCKLVNTVHDSIVLDLPYKHVDKVAEVCVDVMENVIGYASEYMPNLDMSWLLSPMKADVEIGTHYGAEMEIDDWKRLYIR